MLPILLIDGNNLGHVLGYIDKAAGHYDSASLLTCLDSVARHLASLGQEVEIILFLDDPAAERLGGWHVQVASVPDGDADAAIRVFAQTHVDRVKTLVSGDQTLCDDATMWGVICLSPQAFVSHYLVPARNGGFLAGDMEIDSGLRLTYVEVSQETSQTVRVRPPSPQEDRGESDRQRQIAALKQTEATLRGEPPPPPEVFKLDLDGWTDASEFALYLAEHHLCPEHDDLTAPGEMITAIREHCSHQSRYFTSGRVINRVFRLFLCRPEHSLSLDDLARLAQTRRRKIRAAINRQGERLGILEHR